MANEKQTPKIDEPHYSNAVETSLDKTGEGYGDTTQDKLGKELRVAATEANASFGRFLKSLDTDHKFRKGQEDAELLVIEDFLEKDGNVAYLQNAEAKAAKELTALEEAKDAAEAKLANIQNPEVPEEEAKAAKEEREATQEKEEKITQVEINAILEEIEEKTEEQELVAEAMKDSGISKLEARVNKLVKIVEAKDAAVKPKDTLIDAISTLKVKKAAAKKARAEKKATAEAEEEK